MNSGTECDFVRQNADSERSVATAKSTMTERGAKNKLTSAKITVKKQQRESKSRRDQINPITTSNIKFPFRI